MHHRVGIVSDPRVGDRDSKALHPIVHGRESYATVCYDFRQRKAEALGGDLGNMDGWKEPRMRTVPQHKERAPRHERASLESPAPQSLAVKLAQAGVVLGLIGVGSAIVYAAGGTKSVYPHLFYVPVVLAGYFFAVPGALIAGVASGLAAGPFMPLDRSLGTEQNTLSWIYRLVFLTGVGVLTATLVTARHRLEDELAQTAGELYVAYGKCLTTFASLVSMRDEPTAHHCERVAANATAIGRAIGLDEQELRELHWEGILHDLGKVATPAEILLKPGSLTDAEYAEIKKHAKVGAEILESISPRFRLLADGVRSHHEQWDGNGYPDGLSGDAIPLNGRILAIVDVFEALTSQRPYRDAMRPFEAIAIIEEEAGKHFDPKLVNVFLSLHEKGKILVQGDPVPDVSSREYPVPGYSAIRRGMERSGRMGTASTRERA